MKSTQFLCVNGIMTKTIGLNGLPETHNWCDFFEDYYQNAGYPCTKYEYTSGAFTRWIHQGKRVEQLIELCKRSTNKLVYVGHSNGCELFSRVIRGSDVKFEAAHLFSAAMDADCNENGINYALLSGRVGKVYLYCSKKDSALKKWASKTSFLRPIGLGYGLCGLTGPKNVLKQVESLLEVTWNNKFDHSTWFNEKNMKASHDLTYRGIQ